MFWSTRKINQRHPKGAILIATLGLIVLMTFLVIEFLTLSTAEFKRLSLQADQDELRTYAYSSLEITLAVLTELQSIDKALRSPSQGWGNPLAYAENISFPEDIKSTVFVEDETGKIPLNIKTDPKLLNLFFEKIGFDLSQSNTLTDSLLDWMDADDNARLNGAESSYYDRKNPPYKPTGEPITYFEELLYIKGFDEYFFDEEGKTDERFDRLKANATLVGEGPININTAPDLILEVLEEAYGIDATAIQEKRKQLQEGNTPLKDALLISNKDLNITQPSSQQKPSYGFDSKSLKVTIETSHGDNRFQLICLLATTSEDKGKSPENDAKESSDILKRTSKTNKITILRLVENAPLS
jgi:general secretion pathway protein K